MTELLLVVVLSMGGLLALMVMSRALIRNAAGAFVTLALSVLLIGAVAAAGVALLHRVSGGVSLAITNGMQGLQQAVNGPATGSTARPSPVPGPPPPMLAAERLVASMGYHVLDPTTFHPEFALHVLVGEAGDGGAVPHHQWAFFFDGTGTLLGQDAALPSASVLVLGQGPATAALAYQLYALDDADCCPTLGKAAVRFRLERGGVLRRLDPLPVDEERRACCPPGTTPAAEPVAKGSRRQ
ncbi:MAG TPA: LppP/LprE family lipoprotein [Candidatus Dormibacteraeota bacterium]|nr:LppP/LprE family lipoprotein [Candidatus Dormibacteraeota bacterium]